MVPQAATHISRGRQGENPNSFIEECGPFQGVINDCPESEPEALTQSESRIIVSPIGIASKAASAPVTCFEAYGVQERYLWGVNLFLVDLREKCW